MSKAEDRLFEACSETWDEQKGVERLRRFAVGFGIAWYFEQQGKIEPGQYANRDGFLETACRRVRQRVASVGDEDQAAFLATAGCLTELSLEQILGGRPPAQDPLPGVCRATVHLATRKGCTPETFIAMGIAWGFGMAIVADNATHAANEDYWEDVTQFVAWDALEIDTEEEPFEELFMAYYEGHSPDVFPESGATSNW